MAEVVAMEMRSTLGPMVKLYSTAINTLAAFYNSLLTAISYLERIFETIDEPVSVQDAPDAAGF